MEILQLKYFYESAKYGSFAKTAKKYFVPTTSVSASVKRLEEELNCKLFDRFSNKIVLNSQGHKFLKSLDIIFDELNYIVAELNENIEEKREIKLLVRAMRSLVTDYIIEYKLNHFDISFRTVFDFNEKDIDKYDLIIDTNSDMYKGYGQIVISRTPIKFKVHSSHPLCGKSLKLSDLNGYSFISVSEESPIHQVLIKLCENAGFTPDIILNTNDILCYRKFLISGSAIGLGRCNNDDIQDDVKYLDIEGFELSQAVYAHYKERSFKEIEPFINFIRDKSKNYI